MWNFINNDQWSDAKIGKYFALSVLKTAWKLGNVPVKSVKNKEKSWLPWVRWSSACILAIGFLEETPAGLLAMNPTEVRWIYAGPRASGRPCHNISMWHGYMPLCTLESRFLPLWQPFLFLFPSRQSLSKTEPSRSGYDALKSVPRYIFLRAVRCGACEPPLFFNGFWHFPIFDLGPTWIRTWSRSVIQTFTKIRLGL